jgi:protoheme IX farnesyltransferase
VRTPALVLQSGTHRLRHYFQLTKPRVVSLIVFCAVIGMFLAVPGMVPWRILLAATAGIALVAGAAAAVNCLIEQKIDARMARTRGRPSAAGRSEFPGNPRGFRDCLAASGCFCSTPGSIPTPCG